MEKCVDNYHIIEWDLNLVYISITNWWFVKILVNTCCFCQTELLSLWFMKEIVGKIKWEIESDLFLSCVYFFYLFGQQVIPVAGFMIQYHNIN